MRGIYTKAIVADWGDFQQSIAYEPGNRFGSSI